MGLSLGVLRADSATAANFIDFESVDRGSSRQRKGEGAETCKQIRHALGSSCSIAHKAGHHCFRLARGLEESARRQPDLHARKLDLGGCLKG